MTIRIPKFAAVVAAAIALAVGIAACTSDPGNEGKVQDSAQAVTGEVASRIIGQQPAPKPAYSQERQVLIEKLKRMSDPNHLGYINLLTTTGTVIAHLPIKGAVVSANSTLTNTEDVRDCGQSCAVTQGSPDLNGTWGPNGSPDSYFWLTPQGALMASNLPYIYSDQPLEIGSVPVLTYSADPNRDKGIARKP